MQAQTKRYRTHTQEDITKERQLSSLFYIVSSNLLLATKLLGNDCPVLKTKELEFLSREAKILASELVLEKNIKAREGLLAKTVLLKHRILKHVTELYDDLTKMDLRMGKNDLVLARRLLRESQRGLATVQE